VDIDTPFKYLYDDLRVDKYLSRTLFTSYRIYVLLRRSYETFMSNLPPSVSTSRILGVPVDGEIHPAYQLST
jgi:hypothetical protein